MDKKKVVTISIPLFLLALALAFGLWQWQTARALDIDLTANREKAYYNSIDGLSSMEADLSKVLIAQSAGQQALLLSRIASLANSVSENLAVLPASYGADADGLKFLAQTADYAQALATAAAEGTPPSDEDLEQLRVLQTKCKELREHLENGVNFTYEENISTGKATSIEYPTLLYDGPFSDGITQGEPKGITGAEITAEEALAIAPSFIGTERVLSAQHTVDVYGPIPAIGISLTLSDMQLTAAVTKQGGKILWMTPETAGFSVELDMEECILHAKAFLTSRGFGDVIDSYYQQYDGMAVISFAALQDDVVLYPDLIKVQVRMDTGAVIGLEARHYWMNHTIRERLIAKLSEAEAKAYVSDKLKITSARLCVIPISDGLGTGRTEALCWEFDGSWEDNRYLIYIDAETGKELEVLKVVVGGGGVLTI